MSGRPELYNKLDNSPEMIRVCVECRAVSCRYGACDAYFAQKRLMMERLRAAGKLKRVRWDPKRIVAVKGVEKTLEEWLRDSGIKVATAQWRVHQGMLFEDAISVPAGQSVTKRVKTKVEERG